MEAAAHGHHERHEMPTSGRALDAVAFSATLHCLTGCAIGEVAGMAIGTALGFSNLATIVLAVLLAFLFGYGLTSLPLLRAGLALGAVIPIALASDTLSIGTMEVVDNVIMVAVPGAMEAGVGDVLFWGALSVALAIAGVFAFPVNRWLIARGKGHVAVHETGIHGGPPTRVVAAIAAAAAVFGTIVLVAEAGSGDGGGHGGGHAAKANEPAPVRGLSETSNGITLRLGRAELPRGKRAQLRFQIVDARGRPVRDYQVEHEKRMHLILARRDLTGFQHLHPGLARDGTWSVQARVPKAGRYRVFADFKHRARNETLAANLTVPGVAHPQPLPPPSKTARTDDGYRVELAANRSRAGRKSTLAFTVHEGGRPVGVEPYLGAGGHLVALRQRDLAYLHTHPVGSQEGEHHGGDGGGPVSFETEFPSQGRYRLFLQFKHGGRVHTAAFTREVTR